MAFFFAASAACASREACRRRMRPEMGKLDWIGDVQRRTDLLVANRGLLDLVPSLRSPQVDADLREAAVLEYRLDDLHLGFRREGDAL